MPTASSPSSRPTGPSAFGGGVKAKELLFGSDGATRERAPGPTTNERMSMCGGFVIKPDGQWIPLQQNAPRPRTAYAMPSVAPDSECSGGGARGLGPGAGVHARSFTTADKPRQHESYMRGVSAGTPRATTSGGGRGAGAARQSLRSYQPSIAAAVGSGGSQAQGSRLNLGSAVPGLDPSSAASLMADRIKLMGLNTAPPRLTKR